MLTSSGSSGASSDASRSGSGATSGGVSGGSGNGGASGSSGNGGASGSSGNGGANAGGSFSSGGTNPAGSGGLASGGAPSTGGASQTGGNGGRHDGGASVDGAAGVDGSSDGNLCGPAPCLPTKCAGKGCGPAVCCLRPNGPICIHGASSCSEADGGSGRQVLECFDRNGSGDFSKACTTDQDCFVAEHWAGCCRIQAIGLNVVEKGPFAAFESSCGGMPPCGCCCDRATTDEGMNVASSASIGVACVGGECTTRSP